MISDRNRGIQHLVLICQGFLVTIAFWIWFWLFFNYPIDSQVLGRYVIYNEFVLLGLLMGFRSRKPDIGLHTLGLEETTRQSFSQLGTTLFYLLLYLVAVRGEGMSRLVLFSFIPLLYLILFVTNHHLPGLIGRLVFRGRHKQKVLLVGPKYKAHAVKRWLNRNKHLGLDVFGLLTDDDIDDPLESQSTDRRMTTGVSAASEVRHYATTPEASEASTLTVIASTAISSMQTVPRTRQAIVHADPSPGEPVFSASPFARSGYGGNGWTDSVRSPKPVTDESLPILGRPEELEKILTGPPGIVKVIMVEFPRGASLIHHYTDLCEARGVRLLVVADIDQIFGHPVTISEDRGLCLINLREEPLEDPFNRFFKRCLDIAVSGFVVMFILPVCALVVWCAQRLQSPGPLFYLQERPGILNRPFNIYKFRTLYKFNPDENRLPKPGDPRVYPAGRLFRRFSLDEIPQFWNVLRGDMSVVGPRPHLMVDNERFLRQYNKAYVRSYVKPGITGLAQARGFRGSAETSTEVASRMKSDIEYLENWSFWLDCWLIVRTAVQMIVPPKTAL